MDFMTIAYYTWYSYMELFIVMYIVTHLFTAWYFTTMGEKTSTALGLSLVPTYNMFVKAVRWSDLHVGIYVAYMLLAVSAFFCPHIVLVLGYIVLCVYINYKFAVYMLDSHNAFICALIPGYMYYAMWKEVRLYAGDESK